MTQISALNQDWRTDGLQFNEGPDGLPVAELTYKILTDGTVSIIAPIGSLACKL